MAKKLKTARYWTRKCPNCGYEYPNWFVSCPKCHAAWNEVKTDVSETGNVFTSNGHQNIELAESSSLYKDRKGPGGFYVPFEKEVEDKEGINVII